MMLKGLTTILVLCWTIASAYRPTEYKNDVLNDLVDTMLGKFDQEIINKGLDPADLPDVNYEFSKKILFVNYHGEARAYNGTLDGIASTHRTADAEYVLDDKGRAIGLTTSMSTNALEGFYRYIAKFMDLGPKGDIDLHIEEIKLSFSAALDEHKCVFVLQKLNIDNIGHIKIKIHGLGPLDWIADLFGGIIANTVEVFLRNLLENQFTSILNNVLDNFDLYHYRLIIPFIHCDRRKHTTPAPTTMKIKN